MEGKKYPIKCDVRQKLSLEEKVIFGLCLRTMNILFPGFQLFSLFLLLLPLLFFLILFLKKRKYNSEQFNQEMKPKLRPTSNLSTEVRRDFFLSGVQGRGQTKVHFTGA